MYAANLTGAIWAVDEGYEPAEGVVLFKSEPTQDQLAVTFPEFLYSYGQRLCSIVDNAADAARLKMVGDPLRASEYQMASAEAAKFKRVGYPDYDIPRTVAAWAISGRSAREAADEILFKADQFDNAIYFIRETRLSIKQQILELIDAGDTSKAREIAVGASQVIQDTVAGVENI
ncbi:phage tail protein [Pseudomonas sp. EL_65y_Pfl1_R32]|uniref:phage tail protein n=1 Tax=Pseudomonas sp. EL_65y_Pfl1_R32 TaxID=3088696 RepID=UPI0030DD11A4